MDSFSELLLDWYHHGHRDLPWRAAPDGAVSGPDGAVSGPEGAVSGHDPYRIWVSEIMLQQTRAQAVIPYYQRFLKRFPTVEALAAAPEPDVLALWSGLGYYSRARNLRRAAQEMVAAGGFPREYAGLRAMPGIGDYTAAAIASIAFGLPHAVLDGNVMRVVARVENDAADIGAAGTRARFRAIAQAWLDPGHAGPFNQALMELGATVCLPAKPLCPACPVAAGCRGREAGTVDRLPVKLRRKAPVRIEGVLLVVRHRGRVLLRQRDADARRMAGFWDLPSPEHLPGARLGEHLGEIRHTITHHHYTLEVRSAGVSVAGPEWGWFRPAELTAIPLSTTARKALRVAGML
jgi:A/G-specific adenine glycosylase